jgi:hypothetical protein
MRGYQSKELAEIEGKNQRLLQANQSAAAFMSQASASIAEILANPDIPANQKDALIARQNDLIKNYMAVSGGIMNLNLGKLLKFGKNTSSLVPIPAKPGEEKNNDVWNQIHFGQDEGPERSTTKKILDPGGYFT